VAISLPEITAFETELTGSDVANVPVTAGVKAQVMLTNTVLPIAFWRPLHDPVPVVTVNVGVSTS
jgi:hypothetical protein